jgi:multimeric flavodoxin WrbA
VKDDLAPVLEKIERADAILVGSPIYLGVTTGVTRCFLERLIYPYLVYDAERSSLFKKKIRTAFIYTAGATDDMVRQMGIDRIVQGTEMVMERIFGSCESFFVTDTLQFDDYSKFIAPRFDPDAKMKRHREQFPLDCKKAYELGARLVREDS